MEQLSHATLLAESPNTSPAFLCLVRVTLGLPWNLQLYLNIVDLLDHCK